MTAQNYARALSRVLVHEGGYADHPKDPGGATMKGVTQGVYDAYRKRRDEAKRSVRQITDAELQAIYRRQYWDVVKGDSLPEGVDYAVFDGAVNSGPSQAVKWLQRALGSVKVDGVIGEATLAAVEAYPDHDRLIALMLGRRLAFLQALRTWSTFGRGWSARVAQVKQIGQAWATGSVGPDPAFVSGGNAKATIDQAKPLPTKAPADATTGAGIGSGGLGGVLEQARQQLDPLAASSQFIGNIVAALVITGVVLTAGGFAYRWWAARKGQALADALDLPDGVTA
ncbi:Lysozyme family protein [Bosea sp. 62]|uniref:glycoside hydrolase family 108 protein n=1 Tax=unclassified Bosea (in: a-proteobacteria) TaxID=2653178 RepID=UPI00125BE027|nr:MULTISPECIES: glycoside hydrolase family 108 protein [unclassified Bosea (in: a-proteobacteria)]CAD5255625.1 Lysozyme family protein [Bosea sp. 7B]CAD5275162.1 Lysozyme family protein [Bosea sp. 21B]CAD5276290.1 Lysozyme family protein [Bosea sp. 46]VVT60023.1 N-acetylmuramidase [Bosea sp. EC-HK365B]VXB52016.1 Lysozyme family protein [Bosea sp. 62]